MSTLVDDHSACAELLVRSGSSFGLPIRMLPAGKRRGTTALYAFCRRADDIVDDASDAPAARAALDAFADELESGIAGAAVGDPVIRAVVDTVRRFAVPVDHLRFIIDGVRMDLDRNTYDTFGDVEQYCRRVAGAVGLAAIHIWGFHSAAAIPAAHACGLAFQLTNILRDVPEDLARGRIYLPLEDFTACGCRVEDLRAGRIGPEFDRLAALSLARAERAYDAARPLDGMLSTDGRVVFRAMFGVYRAMLGAVARAGSRLFDRRMRPSRTLLAGSAIATMLTGTRRRRLLA